MSAIGGLHIRIGPDVGVKVRALRLLGGTDVAHAEEVAPTAPVLDVRAWSLIGGVRVSR